MIPKYWGDLLRDNLRPSLYFKDFMQDVSEEARLRRAVTVNWHLFPEWFQKIVNMTEFSPEYKPESVVSDKRMLVLNKLQGQTIHIPRMSK
jgi:hypothetical protein